MITCYIIKHRSIRVSNPKMFDSITDMDWFYVDEIELWGTDGNLMYYMEYSSPNVWVKTSYTSIDEVMMSGLNEPIFKGTESECKRYLMGLELIK